MAEQTDLLILGGGTGGYVAAIRAAQKGLNVTIVEKYKLGGTCLHKGCIPTKALLRSAEVFDTLKQAASFGIETEAASIDFSKIQQRKEGIIEQLHKGVEGLCKKNKIKILAGEGAILGPSIFHQSLAQWQLRLMIQHGKKKLSFLKMSLLRQALVLKRYLICHWMKNLSYLLMGCLN